MGLLKWISTDDPFMTISNYYLMTISNCQAHNPRKILKSKSHSMLSDYLPDCSVEWFPNDLWMDQISGVSGENLKTFLLVLLLRVSSISICSRYWGLSKCNSRSRELHCGKHLFNAGKLAISPSPSTYPKERQYTKKQM